MFFHEQVLFPFLSELEKSQFCEFSTDANGVVDNFRLKFLEKKLSRREDFDEVTDDDEDFFPGKYCFIILLFLFYFFSFKYLYLHPKCFRLRQDLER